MKKPKATSIIRNGYLPRRLKKSISKENDININYISACGNFKESSHLDNIEPTLEV
ncbi:hypothetical protein [Pseudalgibacter alginicilyticus]|uniref:hypothetical protein n=1 Tax=Pseudalgibacter alginicilyticus TaxID=1736674 RepID=UPI0012FD19BF|nr:hypothetical protein [Pseudalgibacter alginicilyticus]